MKESSWCVVRVGGQQVKASIKHKRYGKFEIIEAEDENCVGKIIDASDVDHCKLNVTRQLR